MPSSSQDSSNSLEPTMPYQYSWPNSWMVTSSTRRMPSRGQRKKALGASPVKKVGYSMPPAPRPSSGGSTTVSVS
jgi:hypothetical protein